MWDLIHNKHNSTSTAQQQQLAQMRQKLISIGEKERILRERSADLEAHRYLLDAHRMLAQESLLGDQILNISPPETGGSNQLAA
jgi:hypothetical protein